MSSSHSVTLPLTFHCLVVSKLGSPLSRAETTVSALTADEALIRVQCCSVNPMDPKLQHHNKFKMPLPLRLGFDFSGQIGALGAGGGGGEGGLALGDEVFGTTLMGGCLAEYVKVNLKRASCIVKRGSLPVTEAATYGVAFNSAYEPLLMETDISQRAGQWIYIAAGAGGVGHFAVQLAKLHGLKVISSGSKPASLDLLRQLGVDHVIDYSKQDVAKEVLAATGGKGADVVFDPSYSASSFTQSAAAVASGGVWLRLGSWQGEQEEAEPEARRLVEQRGAKFTIGDLGRYARSPQHVAKMPQLRAALTEAIGLYEEGKVRPRVTSVLKFDPAAVQQAWDANKDGKAGLGKVVIKVTE